MQGNPTCVETLQKGNKCGLEGAVLLLEMVNCPLNRQPSKLKNEYVFLRIINCFTGVRNGDGMEAEIKTKLIKTCDYAIRVVNKTFDKKLNVRI